MANILLAEDDKNLGLVLKEELEGEEHIVDLVPDGVEAVLKFMGKTYDFVLLDLGMPRLRGVDTLRIIKEIDPDVPVITYSGNAGPAEREEAIARGAIKCLTKPFEVEQLKNEILTFSIPPGRGGGCLEEKARKAVSRD